MTEAPWIYRFRDGTQAHCGECTFGSTLYPERKLYFVQWEKNIAWIVDEACTRPQNLELLGHSETTPWTKVAWASILGEGFDKEGLFKNRPWWGAEVAQRDLLRMNNGSGPPDHEAVLAELAKSKSSSSKKNTLWWQKLLT